MTDRARLQFYVCLAIASVAGARSSFAGERTDDSPPPTTAPAPVVAPAPHPAAAPAPAPAPAAAPAVAPTTDSRPRDQGGASILSWQPIDTRVQIDAMLGFGSDNLNFGIGARGGKTFSNHLYVGGLFVYQVGTGTNTMVNGVTESGSVHGFYIGPEVGYDLQLAAAPFVIRPYMGLGLAEATGSSTVDGMTTSSSSSQFAIWPGVSGTYHFADSAFSLGGDFRLVTGPWGTAVGLFVVGGMYL